MRFYYASIEDEYQGVSCRRCSNRPRLVMINDRAPPAAKEILHFDQACVQIDVEGKFHSVTQEMIWMKVANR